MTPSSTLAGRQQNNKQSLLLNFKWTWCKCNFRECKHERPALKNRQSMLFLMHSGYSVGFRRMLLYLPDSPAILNLLPQTTGVSLQQKAQKGPARSDKVQKRPPFEPLTTLFSHKKVLQIWCLTRLSFLFSLEPGLSTSRTMWVIPAWKRWKMMHHKAMDGNPGQLVSPCSSWRQWSGASWMHRP